MAKSKALSRAVRRYRNWLRYGQKEVVYSNHFFVQLGICAALFLVICGMRSVQAEPVQAALAGIKEAATTEMELGRSIGKLEFVGNFVPESVMVFWNAQEKNLEKPMETATLLLESEEWAWFEGRGTLLAGGEGEVKEVASCPEGGFRLTIAYDNGLTAIAEPLQGVRVAAGERVHEGQSVAVPQQVDQACQVKIAVWDAETYVPVDTWMR